MHWAKGLSGFVITAAACMALSGCGQATVQVSPSSKAPTVMPTDWAPANGYTQADYQAFLDMINEQAAQQPMDYQQQARFPATVNCAWQAISGTLPHDQVMAYVASKGQNDSGVGASINSYMDQCALSQAASQDPSGTATDAG